MSRAVKPKSEWVAKATQVCELIPVARLYPAVVAWTEKSHNSEVWTMAFSGGADSLALLLLIWGHFPERRDRLVALHFNHRLRGRESTLDEKFCRKVCAALGITLRVGQWAGKNKGASEAEARKARHSFFAKEMKKRRTKSLWLAHQQDDIAETVLMRLARGSGTGGLAAPRAIQMTGDGRTHLRPLLALKKSELVTVLGQSEVSWREDSSNSASRYFRNRIRDRVLPEWIKAAGRDALAGAARSRELMQEDDDALEGWAAILARWGKNHVLDITMLKMTPRAVNRRVLHRWIIAVSPDTDLSRQGFEVLLTAIERGTPTRFSLGRKHFAVIKRGELSLRTR